MATGQNLTADELNDTIRSLVDRVVDAKITQELARRGAEVGAMANEAWRDSKPIRRDAAKALSRASDDAARWSRRELRPMLKDLWKRRTVARSMALGAAGAAVPASRELVDTAAARLGIKQREERHWGAFFFGLLIGAAVGAIAAMLTTPKRGAEMRQELGARADELATRAKDEWVPMFERATSGNGHAEHTLGEAADAGETTMATAGDAAADAGTTLGGAADRAADETAEAINESYESVDRESPA